MLLHLMAITPVLELILIGIKFFVQQLPMMRWKVYIRLRAVFKLKICWTEWMKDQLEAMLTLVYMRFDFEPGQTYEIKDC